MNNVLVAAVLCLAIAAVIFSRIHMTLVEEYLHANKVYRIEQMDVV